MKNQNWVACWLMVIVVGLVVGCSSKDPRDAAMAELNKTNIQRLANLYKGFQMKHATEGFRGPKDLEEFKSHIKETPSENLSKMGVDSGDIDSLFTSERDSEPYDIKYDVSGGPRGSEAAVIFEKTGVGGKKMVGFLNSRTEELDAAEADSLMSAKAEAPAQSKTTGKGDNRSN